MQQNLFFDNYKLLLKFKLRLIIDTYVVLALIICNWMLSDELPSTSNLTSIGKYFFCAISFIAGQCMFDSAIGFAASTKNGGCIPPYSLVDLVVFVVSLIMFVLANGGVSIWLMRMVMVNRRLVQTQVREQSAGANSSRLLSIYNLSSGGARHSRSSFIDTESESEDDDDYDYEIKDEAGTKYEIDSTQLSAMIIEENNFR